MDRLWDATYLLSDVQATLEHAERPAALVPGAATRARLLAAHTQLQRALETLREAGPDLGPLPEVQVPTPVRLRTPAHRQALREARRAVTALHGRVRDELAQRGSPQDPPDGSGDDSGTGSGGRRRVARNPPGRVNGAG